MPRTEEQNIKIREEKRELILETALELFATDGFSDTSISKIATNAKISKGLMYSYFKNKEELLKELVIQGISTFTKIVEDFKNSEMNKEDFVNLIDTIIKVCKENMNHWKLYFGMMTQPKILMLVHEDMLKISEGVFGTFEAYFEKNTKRDPFVESRLLESSLDGICMNYMMNPQDFPLEDTKNRLIEIFVENI